MYNEDAFIQALHASFAKYKERGARSTEKLRPIHRFLADTLQGIFGEDYEIHFDGGKTEFKITNFQPPKIEEVKTTQALRKELKVEGKYYPKKIDMAVTYKGKPVFCLGFKFVTSNFSQNANNYFENMMGETANIQRNEIPYAQLIVFRKSTPYYDKNKTIQKWETISQENLNKYVKLMYDNNFPHQPKAIGVFCVDIDEDTDTIKKAELSDMLEEQFIKVMESKLSLGNLFSEIENYKNYFSTLKNK